MKQRIVDAAWGGWALGLVALVVYGALASPYIVDGDNAEFSTLAALGGRAHPSGYPLYVMWLRLWSWLPGSSAAHTAALATAVLGALAIVALHAACRAWGARPLAATIAVGLVAAAPIVLRYHVEAEAFAMNHLAAALVLWLAAERGPARGAWRGAALGLVAGLGLSDHLTCALLAPVGVLGVVRAARESRPATYALAIAGLCAGLLPYAYLWVADGPAAWGTMSGAGDLIGFVLRRDFGGAGSFEGAGHAAVPWTASVIACGATILRAWLWLPALAGLALLGARIARPAGETRWAWALLAITIVLAGPVLASRFDVDPAQPIGRYVCQRFHLLPALLLALPVAAAVELALARAAVVREALATGAALAGFVVLALAGAPGLARVHSPAMQRNIDGALTMLPAGAILVVTDDDHCFGGRYLQLTQLRRPDVSLICSGLVSLRWYRERFAGLAIPPTTGPSLAAALLATGRPLYVDMSLTRVLAAYPSYPVGVMLRVLPAGAPLPSAAEIAALDRDVFRAFDLDYPRPTPDDEYAALAHHRYAAAWAAIARRLDASGDRAAAKDAFDLTRALQPEW
ncbi:MAG TPA: DUF2723 domain-containing protein [Kofleriaceae bacterium]